MIIFLWCVILIGQFLVLDKYTFDKEILFQYEKKRDQKNKK